MRFRRLLAGANLPGLAAMGAGMSCLAFAGGLAVNDKEKAAFLSGIATTAPPNAIRPMPPPDCEQTRPLNRIAGRWRVSMRESMFSSFARSKEPRGIRHKRMNHAQASRSLRNHPIEGLDVVHHNSRMPPRGGCNVASTIRRRPVIRNWAASVMFTLAASGP